MANTRYLHLEREIKPGSEEAHLLSLVYKKYFKPKTHMLFANSDSDGNLIFDKKNNTLRKPYNVTYNNQSYDIYLNRDVLYSPQAHLPENLKKSIQEFDHIDFAYSNFYVLEPKKSPESLSYGNNGFVCDVLKRHRIDLRNGIQCESYDYGFDAEKNYVYKFIPLLPDLYEDEENGQTTPADTILEGKLSRNVTNLHAKNTTLIYNNDGKAIAAVIVMRKLQKMTLKQFLATSINELNIEKRFRLSINLLRALKDFHARGIYHRDIKPDNIMIDPDTLEVKLIDLGSSRSINQPDNKDPASPAYCPFEVMQQFKDILPYTEAADMFSLGIILGEIWGSKFLSPSDELANKKNQIPPELNSEFLNELPGDIKTGITNLFDQSVAFHPNDRCTVDAAIKEMDNLFLNYQKTQITNITRYNKFETAHQAAMTCYDELKNFEPHINNAQPKQTIATVIKSHLDKINDSSISIQEFVKTLNIKTLQNCNTKKSITKKIDSITQQTNKNLKKLIVQQRYVDNCLLLLNLCKKSATSVIQADIKAIQANIDSCFHKLEKEQATIDNYAEINQKLSEKFKAIDKQFIDLQLAISSNENLKPVLNYQNLLLNLKLNKNDQTKIGKLENIIKNSIKTYVNFMVVEKKRGISDDRILRINNIISKFSHKQDADVDSVISAIEKELQQFKHAFFGSQLRNNIRDGIALFQYHRNSINAQPGTSSDPDLVGVTDDKILYLEFK